VAVGAGGDLDQAAAPVVAAGAGRPAAGQVDGADLAVVAGEAAGQRLAPAGAAQDQPLDLGLDDDGVEAAPGPGPGVVADQLGRAGADVYYGMADARIGAFRLTMGPIPRPPGPSRR
jgi:hypothetical protein